MTPIRGSQHSLASSLLFHSGHHHDQKLGCVASWTISPVKVLMHARCRFGGWVDAIRCPNGTVGPTSVLHLPPSFPLLNQPIHDCLETMLGQPVFRGPRDQLPRGCCSCLTTLPRSALISTLYSYQRPTT